MKVKIKFKSEFRNIKPICKIFSKSSSYEFEIDNNVFMHLIYFTLKFNYILVFRYTRKRNYYMPPPPRKKSLPTDYTLPLHRPGTYSPARA